LSEKEILNWLKFDTIRKILESCLEVPKTAKEIETLTGFDTRSIAEDLDLLERHQAVAFSGGKWKATEQGIHVYRKFFG